MINISCDNICLQYGIDTVLDKVSFSLNEQDKLGIVGVNGAGKSSLLKIIAGKISNFTGDVYISKDKTLGFFEQNTGLDSNKKILEEMLCAFDNLIKMEADIDNLHTSIETYAENSPELEKLVASYTKLRETFESLGGYQFRSRCKGILKKFGFDEDSFDRNIDSLSGGEKTRLAIAKLLICEPDILMLDEPTNHLDVDMLFWLEDYLKNYKKTVIIVSHDRYFLDRITNKILEIQNTNSTLYKGNYSSYVEQKQKNDEVQLHHYKNQQKEIARIEAYIEQQRRWNRERNIIAAESRQKQLDKMVRIEKPSAPDEKIRLKFLEADESGNDVLTVKGISKSFGNKKLFCESSFDVKKGDRLFIVGKNGCGKSTLIKILNNMCPTDSGSVIYGYNVITGYYDQENQNLSEEKTVIDELWDSYPNLSQTEVRNTLALFLFKGDDITKRISSLSGGERARITLSKLMLKKVNLLILDEPTNHLDINSREVLEGALQNFGGTIIAVSHDRYFINKLATRIVNFEDSLLKNYNETYSEFRARVDNETKEIADKAKEESSVSSNKQTYLNNKQQQANERKRKNRIATIEKEISSLEDRIASIDAEMNSDAATDYVRLTELSEEKDSAEEKLLMLYEEYESLEI